jgi:hypothetical protein
VTHPFWQDKLSHLAKDLVLSQDVQGSTITTTRSSVFVDGTGSVLGKIKTVDTGKSTERPMSNLDLLEITSQNGCVTKPGHPSLTNKNK